MARFTEKQIFEDAELRKALIKQWDADSSRKHEAFKAYECLKDKTDYYVLQLLLKQFDAATVGEMQYAISNISIFRKIVDKLARVYANGVKRTMPETEEEKKAREEKLAQAEVDAKLPPPPAADPNARPPAPGDQPPEDNPPSPAAPAMPAPVAEKSPSELATEQVEKLAELLDMNGAMKKANRFFRAFLNTVIYIRPMPVEDGKYTLKLEVKPPFAYDVVENDDNPAEPIAYVCSDYVPAREVPTIYAIGDAATVGRTGVVRTLEAPSVALVRTDQIAGGDSAGEKDTREFVWWTKSYHFTTNVKGEIISQADGETAGANPILEMPFVTLNGEQDLCYWAEGGRDLIDTGVRINVDLTNYKHISICQGYGQMFMTGKNLPKQIKVGPNHCIQITQDEGEPTPQVGFMNANPPLDQLKASIEMTVALMLSTNNLSVSGFKTSLGGGAEFASGVALAIDRSESTEDINEQALLFVKKEPEVLAKVALWHDVYKSKGLLSEELAAIQPPKDIGKVQTQFPPAKPIVSEKEELEVIQMRKDLGLNTDVELIMRDDPSLTEAEAREKLAKIKEENKANQATVGIPTPGGPNGNPGQKGNGVNGQNGDQPGNNQGPPNGNPGAHAFPNQG
jgi:hypothetical protein